MSGEKTPAGISTPPSDGGAQMEETRVAQSGRDRPHEEAETSRPALSTPVRILLYFAGWLLVLVGLLGLALPGIQGVLTLVLGASVLSLVSEAAHRWIRALFRPWPKGGEHFERFRERIRERLARFHRR